MFHVRFIARDTVHKDMPTPGLLFRLFSYFLKYYWLNVLSVVDGIRTADLWRQKGDTTN